MKNVNKMTAQEICNELGEYTCLTGDEWQESVDRLCALVGYAYAYSEIFNQALLEELRRNLKWVRKNAKIEEETVTPRTYTIKKIIWNE